LIFQVQNYDLAATLTSGQAFRWQGHGQSWTGVIGNRWVRLHSQPGIITAETAEPVSDWSWLRHYLQLNLDLEQVLATFPKDDPMRTAVAACHGLRLLRQDPWECLASFILSSTKQIVQIRQIISQLCELYGNPVAVLPGCPPERAFPTPQRLADTSEAELRACKMGFRAPHLLSAARAVAAGKLDLRFLSGLPLGSAREALVDLPGVGRKIADCVLLFACGFPTAFPVDVWVLRALRELYFPRRRIAPARLLEFTSSYFGPNAGYAQQYLFHYMRVKVGQASRRPQKRVTKEGRRDAGPTLTAPSRSLCASALPKPSSPAT
jgi:N-glycosylase/DNA lyase